MLSKLRVQHYKSLFDTEVDLEPLTVFIGPNGSGKSNICEALSLISRFLADVNIVLQNPNSVFDSLNSSLQSLTNKQQRIQSKFWHGIEDYFLFEISTLVKVDQSVIPDFSPFQNLSICFNYLMGSAAVDSVDITDTFKLRQFFAGRYYDGSPIENALKEVKVYDFAPINLSNNTPSNTMEKNGQGIAYALVDILHSNREGFDELEERLRQLVPNIKKISLPRGDNQTFSLELIDKYSEHHIPASDISDGTLRILAFLTAIYQEETPSIICFEEIENGVHPWLLSKMMELLKIVSTEGITGKTVQILITTHSPVLLNYVEPYQVRAVELDDEGKTQVHALPTDSVRFQKALEAYDGSLGELWFTNIFGGNPKCFVRSGLD